MLVLGINAILHDPAAARVVDGTVVDLAAELLALGPSRCTAGTATRRTG